MDVDVDSSKGTWSYSFFPNLSQRYLFDIPSDGVGVPRASRLPTSASPAVRLGFFHGGLLGSTSSFRGSPLPGARPPAVEACVEVQDRWDRRR